MERDKEKETVNPSHGFYNWLFKGTFSRDEYFLNVIKHLLMRWRFLHFELL